MVPTTLPVSNCAHAGTAIKVSRHNNTKVFLMGIVSSSQETNTVQLKNVRLNHNRAATLRNPDLTPSSLPGNVPPLTCPYGCKPVPCLHHYEARTHHAALTRCA